MIEKLIFLDIDGVLNSEKYFLSNIKHNKPYSQIDSDAVTKIRDICALTDARIIITSSWRMLTYEKTIQDFNKYTELKDLLYYIVGITGRYNEYHSRGWEINKLLEYLKDKSYNTNLKIAALFKDNIILSTNPKYIIIDDDTDMEENQLSYFIKTDARYGLTKKQSKQITKMLL